jgi:hypothetical protein
VADEFLSVRLLAVTRFFVRKGRRLEAFKTATTKQRAIFCIELLTPPAIPPEPPDIGIQG